jgi:hypothetical protein
LREFLRGVHRVPVLISPAAIDLILELFFRRDPSFPTKSVIDAAS